MAAFLQQGQLAAQGWKLDLPTAKVAPPKILRKWEQQAVTGLTLPLDWRVLRRAPLKSTPEPCTAMFHRSCPNADLDLHGLPTRQGTS